MYTHRVLQERDSPENVAVCEYSSWLVAIPTLLIVIITASFGIVTWLAYDKTVQMSNSLNYIVGIIQHINNTEINNVMKVVSHLVTCLNKNLCPSQVI